MDAKNIILCGLGGQGILFMTKILAHAALERGLNVIGAETHGMAQRGGSVISHLRIGDAQSSLVRTGAAHFLVALDENECYRNLAFLAPKAQVFVNTDSRAFPVPEVLEFFKVNRIDYNTVPAGSIAMDLDAPFSSNLALIGFFAAFNNKLFGSDELRHIIDLVSPDRFKGANLAVFDAALQYGRRRVGRVLQPN